MAYKVDLAGNKYGRLTVLGYECQSGRRKTMWKCICDCGNIKIVDGSKLKNGHTRSCGCFSRERIKNQNYKTGMSKSKLYYAYRNMKNRCFYEKSSEYKNYGGRGITICDEWIGEKGFENFKNWSTENGYSEELTIDRIDCDGNYEPNNCRWVNLITQANNKRNNRYISINGEIGTVANMARKYNVDYWNLMRYSKGGKNCKYPHLKIEVANVS